MSNGNGSPKGSPPGYSEKFADFIRMREDATTSEVKAVVIAKPRVIGDSYEEVIESLSRLADAGLMLSITER
jgi:hypothetical protein